MDPNAIVEEMRELYNEVQDSEDPLGAAIRVVELFDDLDSWLVRGGFLPHDWEPVR